MIRQAAFASRGPLLKGNLHCHTTRSDGKGTPRDVISQYGAAGYDFLALTDHNFYNDQDFAPEAGVLILPGMELDSPIEDPGVHNVHVVSIGPEGKENGFARDQRFRFPTISAAGQAQPMIDTIRNANNLPILCHPEWSGIGVGEIEELSGFSLMEVWNSGNVFTCGLDRNSAVWDELLCHGRKIYGVANDDGHHMAHNCHGFVRVLAKKERGAILEALKNGAFYASCGPEIYDFYVADGVATLLCSPVSQIRFRNFRFPYAECRGWDMTGAQQPVCKGTGYIRAEVVDAQGRRAWTNPIFLPEDA